MSSKLGSLGEALEYVSQALENSPIYFGHGTDNAWDEAVQLVLHVAQLPVDSGRDVLSRPLTDTEAGRLQELLHRRIAERIPLPYLLGRAWFAGLEFICDERALVPRSPLAELIREDFRPWYPGEQPRRLLDLCCGGGCIGLAAACYNAGLEVDLADIDPAALSLAHENLALLGLQDRVRITQSDLFQDVPEQHYDLILSNPPYVDARDIADMPAEYRHEPPVGLGAGHDGLDIVHRILAAAGEYLADDGLLVVELGNSWVALEEAYPDVPFTWVEFADGGDGVFAMTAQQWQEYSASWRR